jgi:hypothetical protein
MTTQRTTTQSNEDRRANPETFKINYRTLDYEGPDAGYLGKAEAGRVVI